MLKSLSSHIEGEKKIIDEVALLKIIENSKEANKLLIRSKGDTFVFHTSKEELSLTIVQNPVYREKIRCIHKYISTCYKEGKVLDY